LRLRRSFPIKVGGSITVDEIKTYLLGCGYRGPLLKAEFRFGSGRLVDLAAFADEPTDARSACIALIQRAAGDVCSEVTACRELGAPLVMSLTPTALGLWQQGQNTASLLEEAAPGESEGFFRKWGPRLAPDAVFRAKTLGKLDPQFQLSFVDAGLMPSVEREIGQRLTGLIERVVHNLRQALWPKKSDVSVQGGDWLFKSTFWLLAAKILQDKRVTGFRSLGSAHVDDVFQRIARHYNSRQARDAGIRIRTSKQRDALQAAAAEIFRFSHLGHVTTECLAHIYESALITDETRRSLGTHSTPQYLVDYLVWKLAPWIEKIPADERDVFEPACGHAAFLVASMRVLKELLLGDRQVDREKYLRRHLHGIEIDSFALEIARLSLTLADIPNPNGWDLVCGDMFTHPRLSGKAKQATIILGNPPFQDFSRRDRNAYAERGVRLSYSNKTAEVLAQVLPHLRPGGVFGFILPQGILHSKNADRLRHLICRDFEIQEICLFPDKVFSFSDAECAAILGRRVQSPKRSHLVSYRRIREDDIDAFRNDYVVSSTRNVLQESMCQSQQGGFVLPDLPDIWRFLQSMAMLGDIAEIGEGLSYRSDSQKRIRRSSSRAFPGAVRGFMRLGRSLQTHSHPPEVWMNISPEAVGPVRLGADMVPQVLLNHVRAARGPWRIKAFIDRDGHAFTNNYNAVRPKDESISLEFLWALLNSPLANAFAFTHARGRHNLPGVLRQMPVPNGARTLHGEITRLVAEYLRLAKSYDYDLLRSAPDTLRVTAVQIDALVLREYDLPPRSERELLDLFAGHPRVGVPFRFDRYFPEDFEPTLRLHEYLSGEFRNSRASSLLATHRTFDVPEVSEALRRATEDFEE